jgi:NAD(P)-dependent dehydrogenase (short-subunit alcohol dehydrogenase family)
VSGAPAGRLDGRVAIVTGGASGVGRAICERFHEEGATVVAVDLAEPLSIESDAIEFRRCDVGDEAQVAETVAAFLAAHGRLDILMNAAGVQEPMQDVDELSLAEWERVMRVNVTGTFLFIKHALPTMRAQESGVIINTSSGGAGINASPGFPVYSASKGAVTLLTKSVALQVAHLGIRVNALAPGMIETPMMESLIGMYDAAGLDGRAKLGEAQPIGRFGTPAEVAAVAAFLASDDASLVTGVPLPIDGGMNAGYRSAFRRDPAAAAGAPQS